MGDYGGFIIGRSYQGASVQGYVEQNIKQKELEAYDVISYGATNTYPQEVEYALSRSSIAKACTQKLCEFIYGEGFADELTARSIVNNKGETLDEILYQASKQLATFNGFALLLNANILGEHTSIEAFPFEYVRLGLPDENGHLTHARVWDNWALESPRRGANLGEIYSIDLFDPSPERIRERIAECGGIEHYKGQLLYFTLNAGFYPECTFDSAFEQVLATGNIPVFTNNYIRNGFSSSAIIARKDVLATEEERLLNQQQFQALSGIRNAGGIGVVEGDFELLDISNTQQLDKQYIEIHSKLKEDIGEAFSQPPILRGSVRDRGFPNQDEMMNAHIYYNSQTRMYRRMLSREMEQIASNFVYSLGSDFTIQETTFA